MVRTVERNSPGSIIVNMNGKRFMNESMPYVEACHHMYGGEYGQGPGPRREHPGLAYGTVSFQTTPDTTIASSRKDRFRRPDC